MSIIIDNFLDENECREICKYAEYKKQHLIKTLPKYFEPTFNNLTNKKNQLTTAFHNQYNFFIDNPSYIKKFVLVLKKNISNIEWPVVVQSWVNIYEKGEGIGKHQHRPATILGHPKATKVYASNIFIGGNNNVGVNYIIEGDIKKYKNELGQIHLFDGSIEHYVDLNPYTEKRYTIGITISCFDGGLDLNKIFFPFEKYNYIDNLYLIVNGFTGLFIIKDPSS